MSFHLLAFKVISSPIIEFVRSKYKSFLQESENKTNLISTAHYKTYKERKEDKEASKKERKKERKKE